LSLDSVGQNLSESVKIVLMRTSHPGNVGAVARAIKNMGFTQLYLVNPTDCTQNDRPCSSATSPEAISRAAGAEDLLERAVVCTDIDEAISDCHIVIGASARSRKMVWPLMNPRDCASLVVENVLKQKDGAQNKVALIFGNEASGLSNDELQRCHYHVNIPAIDTFSSLNLAMAAQLITYEIRMCFLLDKSLSAPHVLTSPILSPNDGGWDESIAPVDEMESFFEHLEDTLVKIGFHDPSNPRQLMARLRRLFQRAHLDKMEVNILRGVLSASQKQSR